MIEYLCIYLCLSVFLVLCRQIKADFTFSGIEFPSATPLLAKTGFRKWFESASHNGRSLASNGGWEQTRQTHQTHQWNREHLECLLQKECWGSVTSACLVFVYPVLALLRWIMARIIKYLYFPNSHSSHPRLGSVEELEEENSVQHDPELLRHENSVHSLPFASDDVTQLNIGQEIHRA